MSAEKLVIKYEQDTRGDYSGSLRVDFNPSQLSFVSSAQWDHVEPTANGKNANPGKTIFRRVAPETLTLGLFFDTYSPYASDKAGGVLGFPQGSGEGDKDAPKQGESVEHRTSRVLALARVRPKLGRPPACMLKWGVHSMFHGVLTNATRTYTLFLPDGTPVRATMECSFREVMGKMERAEPRSADATELYMVRPGDTLMSIAASYYGDDKHWRVIAHENGIENPRVLVVGSSLVIPKAGRKNAP